MATNRETFEEYKTKNMTDQDVEQYSSVFETSFQLWEDTKAYGIFLNYYNGIKKQSLLKVSIVLKQLSSTEIFKIKNQIYQLCGFPLPHIEETRKVFVHLAEEIEYDEKNKEDSELLKTVDEENKIKTTIRKISTIERNLRQLNFHLDYYKKENNLNDVKVLEEQIKNYEKELKILVPECDCYCGDLSEDEYNILFKKNNNSPVGTITKEEIEKLLQDKKIYRIEQNNKQGGNGRR